MAREENPWDRANRARIGGFIGGLAGVPIVLAIDSVPTAALAGFVAVGALLGALLPYRP